MDYSLFACLLSFQDGNVNGKKGKFLSHVHIPYLNTLCSVRIPYLNTSLSVVSALVGIQPFKIPFFEEISVRSILKL